MLVAVVNVNTSAEMTGRIGAMARAAAAPGTEILATQPRFGPMSVEGAYESFVSAAAIMDLLPRLPPELSGVVLAGFGEHGREGARELLGVPVVDITEAGPMMANLVGWRYAVVTTLPRCVPQIEDSLRTLGLLQRCAAVEASGVAVLDLAQDEEDVLAAIEVAAKRAMAKGADVICLGCAGMTGLERALSERLGAPVVDPVAAAVKLVEALCALGLRTSQAGPFATAPAKATVGWPLP